MWYIPELSPFENVQRALLDKNPSLATVLEMGINLSAPRAITKETLPAYRAEYADVALIANMSDAVFETLDVNTIIELTIDNVGFTHANKKYFKLPLLYKRQTVTYMVNWLFNSGVWRQPWTPLDPPKQDYVYEDYKPLSPSPSPKLNPLELPQDKFMYYQDGPHRNGWYYDTVLHRNLKLTIKDNFDPNFLQGQAEEMVKEILKDFMFNDQLEVKLLHEFERLPVDTVYQVRAKEGSLLFCNQLDLITPYNPDHSEVHDYYIRITLMEDLSKIDLQVGHNDTVPVYPDPWTRDGQVGHLPQLPVYEDTEIKGANVGNTTETPVYPALVHPDYQSGNTSTPKVYENLVYPDPRFGNLTETPVYTPIVYPDLQTGFTTVTPTYPVPVNSIPGLGNTTEKPSYSDIVISDAQTGYDSEPPEY